MDINDNDEDLYVETEKVATWGSCFSNVFSFLWETPLTWNIPFERLEDMRYLSAGTQGYIYTAKLNQEAVAVKMITEGDFHEAELLELKQLRHENIVHIMGICNVEPNLCIVMEYCQYGSLFSYMHTGMVFDAQTVSRWAISVANGMAYLHQNKVMHRDLKSPNILLGDDLVAKVADFGTSRVWETLASGIKTFTGTVPWMAPEVIRNEAYSEKIDVWSFGVVLWELMTQSVPYHGLDSPAIMWGVGSNSLNLPIPSGCPEAMRLLMAQCFSRNPEMRPPFKIIAAHLEVAAEDFQDMTMKEFKENIVTWRADAVAKMKQQYRTVSDLDKIDINRRFHLEAVRRIRLEYEIQMTRANEIFMDACALRLRLDSREMEITLREDLHEACRCNARVAVAKVFGHLTTSEKVTTSQPMPGHIDEMAQMAEFAEMELVIMPPRRTTTLVQFYKKNGERSHVITTALTEADLKLFGVNPEPYSIEKVPMPVTKIDTIVEFNGNIEESVADVNDNGRRVVVGRVDV